MEPSASEKVVDPVAPAAVETVKFWLEFRVSAMSLPVVEMVLPATYACCKVTLDGLALQVDSVPALEQTGTEVAAANEPALTVPAEEMLPVPVVEMLPVLLVEMLPGVAMLPLARVTPVRPVSAPPEVSTAVGVLMKLV